MRRTGFYFIQHDEDPNRLRGEVAVKESDGFVCCHCQRAVFVPPLSDPAEAGGMCRMCADDKDPLKGLICKQCVAKGGCTPFEKQLEMVERRQMLFTDIGK